ncbi:hypothetical protein Dimus_027752 [Dionaea muscipula]
MLPRWINAGVGGDGLRGALNTVVRHFSRSRAENLRKINPKVPPQEIKTIAQSLYDLIRQRGPLTVSNTWIQAKEAGVGGINSKTHLKLMLKWMRGRNLLKLFCQKFGSSKKFFLCSLPDEQSAQSRQGEDQDQIKLRTHKKPAVASKKKKKK